jgi:hypothetical protein
VNKEINMAAHEYLVFYSIIANLLRVIEEYEAMLPIEQSKLEALPDRFYDWVVGFMEEANDMPDENFKMLVDYFENSLNKNTDFHKKGLQ